MSRAYKAHCQPHELLPGEYCQWDGVWYARPPGVPHRLIANLGRHDITVHGDGSITVSPSIEVSQDRPEGEVRWHGYLKHGEWSFA